MNTEHTNSLNELPPEVKLTGSALLWRAARDIALIVIFVTVPVFAASLGGSLEHEVCARVLAIGSDGCAQVDYWWKGHRYTKSLVADERFEPAGKATISLHFVGSPVDAVPGHGGHGPYTTLGLVSSVIPFFIVGGLLMAICRRIWGGQIAPAVRAVLDRVILHFGRQPSEGTRFVVYVVTAFICMGMLNVWLDARKPRGTPDRLAKAFLSAICDRDLNKAAYLVDYDKRYAFMTDAPSWVLLDYDILEVRKESVRYRHTSEVDGMRVVGESVLPVVQNPGGYWIGQVSPPDTAQPGGTRPVNRQ